MAEEVTDKIRKERKEFHIPKLNRERSLYGSEFEIHLRNNLTQRAIARECADWLRRKARFMSNRTQAPMQPFACAEAGMAGDDRTVYMPLHGFTAVDLGYQPGNAVSNLVNKMDEPPFTATYLQLFDQIWSDAEKVCLQLLTRVHVGENAKVSAIRTKRSLTMWRATPDWRCGRHSAGHRCGGIRIVPPTRHHRAPLERVTVHRRRACC